MLDQIVGPNETSFAQCFHFDLVIIGEVCLDRTTTPLRVNSKKTFVRRNGRPALFEPCKNDLSVKHLETPKPPEKAQGAANPYLGDNLFRKEDDDHKKGLSVEDRYFLEIMDKEMVKGNDGIWIAILLFRAHVPLPNNKEVAERRSFLQDKTSPQESYQEITLRRFHDQGA